MTGQKAEPKFLQLAAQLSEVGRSFYSRGWALGTSGNFSAVVSREPLCLAITASGRDKGRLTARDIVQVDEGGKLVWKRSRRSHGTSRAAQRGRNPRWHQGPQTEIPASSRPSDETELHLAIVHARNAGAVLHTHSVWSTILSEVHARRGGLSIEGYEMLKGLDGVRSHQHREWLPIIENSQDIDALAGTVEQVLARCPEAHAFLLEGHGLYTWGSDLAVAKRHVEILEFLLEVVGRRTGARAGQEG